jgi:hypothetical protein
MSYSKPEVIRLTNSVEAIRSAAKGCVLADSTTNTATSGAYEADE